MFFNIFIWVKIISVLVFLFIVMIGMGVFVVIKM